MAFMNSDDAWLPDKLEKQVTVMEEDRMLGACFTRVYLVDESGNDLSEECRDMAELFDRKCSTQKEYLHTLLQSGIFFVIPQLWSENLYWIRSDISIFCIASWQIMICGFGL